MILYIVYYIILYISSLTIKMEFVQGKTYLLRLAGYDLMTGKIVHTSHKLRFEGMNGDGYLFTSNLGTPQEETLSYPQEWIDRYEWKMA